MEIKEMQEDVYIVAELSANHGHKLQIALDTVKAAADAGANAIKIQTYTPDTITIDCNNDYFTIKQGTIWDGRTLYELYKEAYTPWEWQEAIQNQAFKSGIDFFSSPFDNSAVDFLEKLNVPKYKIASFEITDIPLIKYVASKKRPIIISTGIATFNDIEQAVVACREMENNDITLLKATSSYPAPVEDTNLKTMLDMGTQFNVKIGISDHTIGIAVPSAAVALGATLVEKHFIIDKSIRGPDATFSATPKEFSDMVNAIRTVSKSIGIIDYELSNKAMKSREFSRSLFVVKDIKKGEMISKENVRSIRPGFGLAPKYYNDILGKKVKITLKRGTPLSWDVIIRN
jgi:pseudaminic acid synthase